MLTTGPVAAYPEVLAALGRPIVYDTDPAFQHFYENVVDKARRALRLSTPPMILQGEAILGIEAAAAGLIGREDVVLNLVSGVSCTAHLCVAIDEAGQVFAQVTPPRRPARR